MEGQLRRYFLGLVAFGFVVSWQAAGIVTAALGAATCAAVVAGPRLLRRKPKTRRQRPVRTRPLRTESDLPLVPDEPSLIVELGG